MTNAALNVFRWAGSLWSVLLLVAPQTLIAGESAQLRKRSTKPFGTERIEKAEAPVDDFDYSHPEASFGRMRHRFLAKWSQDVKTIDDLNRRLADSRQQYTIGRPNGVQGVIQILIPISGLSNEWLCITFDERSKRLIGYGFACSFF